MTIQLMFDLLTTIVYSMLMNKVLYGKTTRLWGDTSGLYGKASYALSGDVSGLIGDCTGVYGYCTGIIGDLDSIPISTFGSGRNIRANTTDV